MKFDEKLRLLMNIASTTNSTLARHVSLDPSFVSRLRRGVRTPAKNENYLSSMAAYFARQCDAGYQKAALCEALRITLKKLPANKENRAKLIYAWFLEDDTKAVATFLDGLTQFTFKKPPPNPATDALQAHGSMAARDAVFYGIKGKQEAVIAFLSLVLQNERPQTLFLYSDEDLEWLTCNLEFTAKWAALLTQVIMRGNKIKIIHTINRDLDEMLAAIEQWLPMYMSGAIEPYYYPKTRDGILRRTLFIAPETAAITSSSVRNGTRNAANFLHADKNTITALIQEYNDFLSLCRPLMRIFTPSSREEYLTILSEFEDEEAASILKSDTLSSLTMPYEVATSIHKRIEYDPKAQILSYLQARTKNFEDKLQKYKFTEIITLPDEEAIQKCNVTIAFADMLGVANLHYTPEEFKGHLQNVIRLLHTFNNYNVYLASQGEMAGYMLYVKEDVGILVAKTSLPSVIFAINESHMTAAFWDYIHLTTGKAVKSKVNKKQALDELKAMVDKL